MRKHKKTLKFRWSYRRCFGGGYPWWKWKEIKAALDRKRECRYLCVQSFGFFFLKFWKSGTLKYFFSNFIKKHKDIFYSGFKIILTKAVYFSLWYLFINFTALWYVINVLTAQLKLLRNRSEKFVQTHNPFEHKIRINWVEKKNKLKIFNKNPSSLWTKACWTFCKQNFRTEREKLSAFHYERFRKIIAKLIFRLWLQELHEVMQTQNSIKTASTCRNGKSFRRRLKQHCKTSQTVTVSKSLCKLDVVSCDNFDNVP